MKSPFPEARPRAQHAEPASHHHRGVEASFVEDERHHRGGRGLAVAARDRDPVLEAHQLGQHLGPRDHGDSRATRLHDLGVVRPHRGRGHDDVRARDVPGRVPFREPRALRSQPVGDG
jgi:hypothetical protein